MTIGNLENFIDVKEKLEIRGNNWILGGKIGNLEIIWERGKKFNLEKIWKFRKEKIWKFEKI